jgi:hypothetical protein
MIATLAPSLTPFATYTLLATAFHGVGDIRVEAETGSAEPFHSIARQLGPIVTRSQVRCHFVRTPPCWRCRLIDSEPDRGVCPCLIVHVPLRSPVFVLRCGRPVQGPYTGLVGTNDDYPNPPLP